MTLFYHEMRLYSGMHNSFSIFSPNRARFLPELMFLRFRRTHLQRLSAGHTMRFFKSKYKSSITDLELIQEYRTGGNKDALALLFERYTELIFGVCMKYLKEPSSSEDATMEIFELLMEKLKSHDVKHFKSWLYVLTKNHCLQIIRKHNKF